MRRPAPVRCTLVHGWEISSVPLRRVRSRGARNAAVFSSDEFDSPQPSPGKGGRVPLAPAFSLVELLTVVFIIALLIAILVPALSSSRTLAKKVASGQAIKAIQTGLEAFRNDNGSSFVQTNGYPPSFVHPPIWEGNPALSSANLNKGAFPFLPGYPLAYGAHWLPAMLMGVDNRGYIKPSAVPNVSGIQNKPEEWYTPDPLASGKLISRIDPYCDSGNLRTLMTKDLPGQIRSESLWTDRDKWSDNAARSVGRLPVVVDGFDYPVLYYAANKNGQPTNMLAGGKGITETGHDPNNAYPTDGEAQKTGVPFYFSFDNAGFTGIDDNDDSTDGIAEPGWDFNGPHPVGAIGADWDAQALVQEVHHAKRMTFARYIMDRKIHRDLSTQDPATINPKTPLRPVNADSYILWSPGADGKWGTNDDISNMPPFTE